jgi:L-lactate dehydrogenase complex protein LldG
MIDRLRDYGAGICRCDRASIAGAVAQSLGARGKQTLAIPQGLPAEWLPQTFSFTPDRDLSYQELDRADGAVTGCTAAIAMTGSILLTHREQEGRRALSLIPDYHLCVIFAEQIVETVPEGIRVLNQFSRRPLTTIAGPSATADIEMIRVKGVHGPRTLDVILAE